jgi:hypothetical protein
MNLNTLKLLLAALCITAACDPRLQQVPSHGSVDELAPPPKNSEGDCSGCYKWSAKPPGGVNGPPWSN